MINNVGCSTTAIINILHSDWSGVPRMCALHVLLVFSLCNHPIVNSLEWTTLLWWFERNIVCYIPWESFRQNTEGLSIKLCIIVQTHLISHSSCAVRNLPNWYFNRRFVFSSFVSITSHINVFEGIILDKVFVAALGIRACSRNLLWAKPIEISNRLDWISGDLHRIWLLWHFYLNKLINHFFICYIVALKCLSMTRFFLWN